MIGHRYPALRVRGIHGSVELTAIKTLSYNNYQTIWPSNGEISVGRSFRRPYRKGYTCSHPEHSSQAFRADDSAYQRESRYCRIFKLSCCLQWGSFFVRP